LLVSATFSHQSLVYITLLIIEWLLPLFTKYLKVGGSSRNWLNCLTFSFLFLLNNIYCKEFSLLFRMFPVGYYYSFEGIWDIIKGFKFRLKVGDCIKRMLLSSLSPFSCHKFSLSNSVCIWFKCNCLSINGSSRIFSAFFNNFI